VLDASDMSGPVVGRLRLEGMTSYEVGPGDKPSIAVFCGEKKVRIGRSAPLRASC